MKIIDKKTYREIEPSKGMLLTRDGINFFKKGTIFIGETESDFQEIDENEVPKSEIEEEIIE